MEIEFLILEIINKYYHEMRETKKMMHQGEFLSLTFSQYHYILAISETEGMTLTDLAERMNVSKPSVTSAVCRLIKLGLVVKEQSGGDKRVFFIRLTPKGQDVIGADIRTSNHFVKTIIESLNDKEKETAVELLRKIITNYQPE